MAKQTKSFIVEIKTSRRTRPVEQPKSIWGKLAFDLKQNLAEEQETSVSPSVPEHCPSPPALDPIAIPDRGEAATSPSPSQFLRKWVEKRAERPKAGTVDDVATFLTRIEQQKVLLVAFRSNPATFTNWRSAWFRQIAGGFGVSIGHDSIDAGGGLRYVVVETIEEVAEFLDDLDHHTQTDTGFQCALTENRLRRAARLAGAKAV